MLFTDELILQVDGRVGVAIRRPRERRPGARMHLGLYAVGADGHTVAVPAVFIRQAPVRRYTVNDVGLRAVERMVAAADGRAVHAEFSIDAVVDPRIDADSGSILPYAAGAAVEFRRGDRRRRHAAAGIGEAPGGGGVPHVLYRGPVVYRDAEQHVGLSRTRSAAEVQSLRIADVGIVEPETVADTVIGELH